MSKTPAHAAPISRDYWRRYLRRSVVLKDQRDVRFRRSQRYPLQGTLRVTVPGHEETGAWSMALVEVSLEGLSAKSSYDVPADREVLIELNPEGAPLVMKGRVVHCTQTLGGFKVGFALDFD